MSDSKRRKGDSVSVAQWLFVHYLCTWFGLWLVTGSFIRALGGVLFFHGVCIIYLTHKRMHDANQQSSAAILEASREAQAAMEAIRRKIEEDAKGPRQ